MQTTFIFSLMGESIVRALFWTLAHSLWQGLALALLTGVVILCTRHSTPVLRYNIFMGLFCLFLVATGITFFRQMRETVAASANGDVTQAIQMQVLPVETPVINNVYTSDDQSWMSVWVQYLNEKATIVVAIWAIILFIRLVKLVVHLGTIQRLRYYRASRADELWQERVKGLAARIGVRRAVELLESSIVRIPMMVGVFKPVILVPLGLLAQLPPQQMEAILLHELAHIRRKDYIINILQSFAEILFFFNPAVLWITSLIREERENCCDDIAIGATRSKKEFIHALVSFQEYAPSAGVALAFPGNKHHLLDRVKRIVHHDNKILNMREKIYLLVCIFITAGLTMAYTKLEQPQARKAKPMEKKMVAMTDTTAFMQDTLPPPAGRRKTMQDTTFSSQDREAILAERERRLKEAEARLGEQAAALDAKQQQLNELYTEQMARLQELRGSPHDGGQGSKGQLDTLVSRDQLQRELAEKNQQLAQSLHSLQKIQQEQFEHQYENNNLQYKRDMEQRRRQIDKLVREQRYQLNNKVVDLLKVQNDLELKQSDALRLQSTDGVKNSITPVISLLAERRLIDTTGDFSFSLDKAGLVVNGKKQSDEVFQVFKEAFLGSPEDYYRHSKKSSSESSSVNQHRR